MRAKRESVALAVIFCGLLFVTAGGCANSADAEFRSRVRSNLDQAVALGPVVDQFIADAKYAAGTAQIDSALSSYRASLASLPSPQDKKLRYLHMRLTRVAADAEDLAHWHRILRMAGRNLGGGDAVPRAELEANFNEVFAEVQSSRERYSEGMEILAATERLCLGTSKLADQRRAVLLGGPSDSTRVALVAVDSSLAAKEQFVRGEIAGVH